MTQLAHTTIPPAVAPSVFYIPEVFTRDGGPYFPELNASDTTKATIVADIASAQHEDIVRVIAVDVANGKSWDASKEIAYEVLQTVISEHGEVPRWCLEFLHEHLGVGFVNSAEQELQVA